MVAVADWIEARPEEAGISSQRLETLRRVVQGWVDERLIPGAVTAVARRGKVVHFETYGSMDDEAGKAMRPDAIFRIYSMTKPIVSLALMLLYEEGKFHLDDAASKFIPEFKDLKVFAGGTADDYRIRQPEREMTVRDLLTHMSGLTFGSMGGMRAASPVGELYARAGVPGIGTTGTLADTVRKLGQLPLQADPGTEWIYGASTDIVGYHQQFGLTAARLARARPQAIVMHPGPMNRGVEITSDVADGPQSVIRRQVANGVAMRMAVLAHLADARRKRAS